MPDNPLSAAAAAMGRKTSPAKTEAAIENAKKSLTEEARAKRRQAQQARRQRERENKEEQTHG